MALVQNEICGLVVATQDALHVCTKWQVNAGKCTTIDTVFTRRLRDVCSKAEESERTIAQVTARSCGGIHEEAELTTMLRPSFVITEILAASTKVSSRHMVAFTLPGVGY